MLISFLYRRKNSGFSIESIFALVANFFKKRKSFDIRSVYVPYMQLWPRGLFANLQFVSRQQPADVYHITGDVHYLMLALPPKRTVLTIHDCVSLDRQKSQGKLVKFWVIWLLYYYLPVQRARYITTVSEKSRQELMRYVGVHSSHKVRVIPNPYNPQYKPKPKPFNTQSPTILHIGTAPHKNLSRLLPALDGINCRLVIVGSLSRQQQKELDHSGVVYVHKEGLSDADMLAEYETCDLVAFVSTYEGFGMPVIEAQAVGRVVVTSAISPLQEVAGPGACLVDPYSVAGIRDGIQRVICDTTYRDELIRQGHVNAAHYTLSKIAAHYESLYNEIAAHP